MANSSYLYGNDTIGGWGMRYFFTFYSEFGDETRTTMSFFEATALLAIVLSSIIANVAIAAAILRYREMRTVTNSFLLNLAIADLVFALGAPLVAATRLSQEWLLGDTVCRMLPYSQFVCGSVLLWTLTLISMDRYRCIVVPPYRSRLTPQRAAILVIAIWTCASILFLPFTFWFHQQSVETSNGYVNICTLVFPYSESITVSLCFTFPAIFFACILPMVLLVYHYQRIFHKLLTSRSKWLIPATVDSNNPQISNIRRDSEISFSGIVGLNKTFRKMSIGSRLNAPRGSICMTHHEEMRLGKHLRVVRILLLNVILVLIMWLPITIVMLLIYIDGRRPTESPIDDYFLRSCHFIWPLIIALLNTVVNPLLYGVLSENFRVCLNKMFRNTSNDTNLPNVKDIDQVCTPNNRKSNVNKNFGSLVSLGQNIQSSSLSAKFNNDRSPSNTSLPKNKV